MEFFPHTPFNVGIVLYIFLFNLTTYISLPSIFRSVDKSLAIISKNVVQKLRSQTTHLVQTVGDVYCVLIGKLLHYDLVVCAQFT